MTPQRRRSNAADIATAIVPLTAALEETNNQLFMLRMELRAQRVIEHEPAPDTEAITHGR